MIRRGRAQGWLKLPIESLEQWASFNGVQYNGISVGVIPGQEKRGSAIRLASSTPDGKPLMLVPKDLIISKENVYLHAKSDKHLREVLEAVGEFGQTTRGSILIFMLVQATHNCPDLSESVGTSCPFSQYIKYLPHVDLPTFWTQEDLDSLSGTSLAPAMTAKVESLYREYELLRERTSSIEWCRKYWWDEIEGLLDFDDWKQVDAMYRSRALEFPGIGDCMVPCVDMANHASGELTRALYEANDNGDGLLLLHNGEELKVGDEINITYGDEKGACEMIFSYGFIEESMKSARDILLGLDISDEDPLKQAKKRISTSAPGVRLIDSDKKGLYWQSDFVWLGCLNEEDGLQFEIAQTVDGDRELVATFLDQALDETSTLQERLEASPLWEVYHLRATSMIQDRVAEQLTVLLGISEAATDLTPPMFSPSWLAYKLRELETDMLYRFYDYLENEKNRLIETQVVQEYLAQANEQEEDFS